MGDLTYSQFKQELKFNLTGREALESSTDWYGSFINTAYKTICTRARLFGIPYIIFIPELETSGDFAIVANTAYVSNPADLFVIRGIWNSTDDRMLRWMTPEEYYDKTGRATSASYGTPRLYTRLGSKVYTYPTTDTSRTWTIYYKKKVTALTGTDVTIIGSEWDTPIVTLATIQAMRRLKEFDLAEVEKRNFIEDVTGLSAAIYQEQRQRKAWIQPDAMYLGRWRSDRG